MNINILIVDDDKLMIDKLVKGINWQLLGVANILSAYNIRQAKEILEKVSISILLSDIEMPQGSGLELLEWIRDKNLPIECVFISSYAYFAYAQKALNLKSAEYLLKPVSNNQLEEVLHKIIGSINEKDVTNIAEETNSSLSVFFERKLVGDLNHSNVIENDLELESLFRQYENISIQYIGIISNHERNDAHNPILCNMIFRKCTMDFFNIQSVEVITIVQRSDYEWYTILGNNCSEDKNSNLLVEFKNNLAKALNLEVKMFCSSKIFRNNFKENLSIHQQMRKEAVVDESGILFWNQWCEKEKGFITPPWELWSKEIYTALSLEEIKTKILSYIHSLYSETKLTITILAQFRKELMQSIYGYLNRQEILVTRIFDGKEFESLYERAVYSTPCMEQFISYLFDKLDRFKQENNKTESVVDKIKKYIEEHLKDDLSRKILAQEVFLSEDYISKLFANATGTSITNYIAVRRMQEAQDFLRHTPLPISQIALEVGYSNFSYFSKTFRDYAGCTPNEYRSRFIK